MNIIHMTEDEWRARGLQLFGADPEKWGFKCPCCGHVATGEEYRALGDKGGMIGFSCIGRLMPKCREAFVKGGKGPCNYAGGGLFQLNPVHVTCRDGAVIQMFEFATPPTETAEAAA